MSNVDGACFRQRVAVLLALTLTAACDTATEPSGPLSGEAATLPGLQGRLTFVRTSDGDDEIYTVNADGSGIMRLTRNDRSDVTPEWSPDGTRIAFASDRNDSSGGLSLYLMAADGSGVTRVTTPSALSSGAALSFASSPTWSPDGARLAFTLAYSTHEDISRIATIGADDSNVAFLTPASEYALWPSWSPDGDRIAYTQLWADQCCPDIYAMRPDGTGHTLLTGSHHQDLARNPVWSPDGSMIAFMYQERWPDPRVRLGVMSADGEFLRDLAWVGDTGWGWGVAWSPDGSGIAYTFWHCDLTTELSCPTPLTSSVNYVSLDGTVRGTIVTDAHSPAWGP